MRVKDLPENVRKVQKSENKQQAKSEGTRF